MACGRQGPCVSQSQPQPQSLVHSPSSSLPFRSLSYDIEPRGIAKTCLCEWMMKRFYVADLVFFRQRLMSSLGPGGTGRYLVRRSAGRIANRVINNPSGRPQKTSSQPPPKAAHQLCSSLALKLR